MCVTCLLLHVSEPEGTCFGALAVSNFATSGLQLPYQSAWGMITLQWYKWLGSVLLRLLQEPAWRSLGPSCMASSQAQHTAAAARAAESCQDPALQLLCS